MLESLYVISYVSPKSITEYWAGDTMDTFSAAAVVSNKLDWNRILSIQLKTK